MSTATAEQWKYSPDPTIERIWRAREELEREAGGDVRRIFEIASKEAARVARPQERKSEGSR